MMTPLPHNRRWLFENPASGMGQTLQSGVFSAALCVSGGGEPSSSGFLSGLHPGYQRGAGDPSGKAGDPVFSGRPPGVAHIASVRSHVDKGLTILFGRVFCGFICPLGTLHHLVSYSRPKLKGGRLVAANRIKDSRKIKYFILVLLLVSAFFGVNFSGVMDPMSFFFRSPPRPK